MSNPIEEAKKKAGYAAVDEYIKSGMVVGVGSGSTVVYVAERLAQRKKTEGLDVICIPTSFQSIQLINEGGLTLGNLAQHPVIDVAIDGADELDPQLNCIKGGGGAQTQEKIIAANAKKFVVVADYRKDSPKLGTLWTQGVPIEVIPMAYVPLMKKFENDFKAKPTLRMAKAKAGPVVTDNGNFILDVHFGPIENPKKLATEISCLTGVVEHGLFVEMAEKAYLGMENGSVLVIDKSGRKTL